MALRVKKLMLFLPVLLSMIVTPGTDAQLTSCTAASMTTRFTAGGASNEGVVQQCISSTWMAVCGTNWDCRDAVVACRQLGYSNPKALASSPSGFWSGVENRRYNCDGSESSLSQCPSAVLGSCSIRGRALCLESTGPCSNGNLRLVGGEARDRGRLELCQDNYWRAFCSLNYNEAATACRQLGYLEYPRIITDGRYGRSNFSQYIPITSVSCGIRGNETRLLDCSISNIPCYYNTYPPASCSIHRGLQCYAQGSSCKEGSVRLVNGSIEQEGRMEVCIGGVWGSVCSSGWSYVNSYVACSQLGHRNGYSHLFSYTMFGSGEGPVFRGFVCQGWEQNIGQCFNRTLQYSPFSTSSCNWNNVIAIRCRDFCSSGDVRLVGGPDRTSGVVEVCQSNLWSLIAEPGWSDSNAAVVCKQLQFSDEGAVAVNITQASYTRPRKAIRWSNVHCTGMESSLSRCSHYGHQLPEGIQLMDKLEVAGVSCQRDIPTNMRILQSGISTAVFTALIWALLLTVILVAVGFFCYYMCKPNTKAIPSHSKPTTAPKHKYEGGHTKDTTMEHNKAYQGYYDETYDVPKI